MITRTVNYCTAYGWLIEGMNEDGSPRMVKTEGVPFVSTNPTKREAFKTLKQAGFSVSKDYVMFETDRTEVVGMDLETFITYGVPVSRTENGRVRPIVNE